MNHLLAALLRNHDLASLAIVLVEATIGSCIAMRILLTRRAGRLAATVGALSFSVVLTFAFWITLLTALASVYPKLSLSVPVRWMIPALAMSLVSGAIAGAIHQHGRRSARNGMLAGSLLACGFSCMLFTGMAGLVRPFALEYDLTAVLIVMVLGAILCGFALWESSNPQRRYRPWLIGTGLAALAIVVLVFGSLAAILPFDAWLSAVARPDDIASSPIAIIVAAEGVVVLLLSLFGSLVDNRVAARDRLEADRFRQLADSTLEGILIHRDGEILDGNESLAALLGIELIELRASTLDRFIVAGSDMSAWSPDRGNAPVETEIVASTGSRMPVEILSRAITYGGRPALVTALRDVRERHASEERIRFLAHHDMLTGLPNRVLLNESLDAALRRAARGLDPLAVLCLDLDGFKMVNDTLGHAAGDQLLRDVADRLRTNLRESDLVARVGGDEFVVLQTTGVQPEQATTLARRIIDCLSPAFWIEGQEVNVGISVGIALYPEHGETGELLLKKADIALYRVKANGRGWFRLFESGMDDELQGRRKLEHDLRHALQHDELILHFQPLVDSNFRILAFEALVRWMHPTLGLVMPAQFIPLAEECGLIIPLGEWVMQAACTAAAGWSQPCRIAVNLSPAQILRTDLPTTIANILIKTGLPPDRLELEITEGVLMDNTDAAIKTLTELRELGTRLVLDDFGTGYSSLSYLQRFAFDKLKVDRSFVQRLASDSGSRAIIMAIIALSRSLDLEVTAEGVETEEQFRLLGATGCQEFQGYLIGRPMPHDEVENFLRNSSPLSPGQPRPRLLDLADATMLA
ncbi:putative bifunctional diguanylate cyclase/phosphodiesterase [Lichenicoccus roseus]|uniref:EAL domain-containing protein n=1 Tax=Lichenicoccus roseus TaxID=2683649 RepID=A0A5R9JAK0_9PROT|nr:EAL domain-containing protein [Lichenicoccus roseus]TLU72631.1 EAL domain-containing protein [Lichenicoccus roseus]